MRKHLSVTIAGSVHGIGLRWSIRQQAQLLGLTGAVWNAPGREVRLEAEGEEAELRKLLNWLGSGEHQRQIERLDEQWGDQLTEGLRGFTILSDR